MSKGGETTHETVPLVGLVLLVVLLALSVWGSRPPSAVLDTEVDPHVFSAARAVSTLRALDPADEPHPIGSAAHAAVRQRLFEQLRQFGLEPWVQEAWSCRPGAVCAPVRNVVARIDGVREAPAVMVSAHYDTVHAAPGAADDMHGIAILVEIARSLTADGPPRNPVVLLATDGEEVGLLGARAFVEHEAAREVAVVVNVDARGTRGRSNMFETSRGNGPLVRLYAEAVRRPSASSLAVEVYRRMPNDTDFTVFEAAGMKGLNFAFIGGVEHYHTARDERERLSLQSVGHQGQSVLAVTRALANADLDAFEGPDAAYTDVLGITLVRWPASASLAMVAVLGLGVVMASVRLGRARRASGTSIAAGALVALVVLVVVPAAAHGVDALIVRLAGHAAPWHAYPLAHRCALWMVPLASGALVGGLFGRRIGAWGLACGGWSSIAVLAVGVVWLLPGASPYFVLPLGAGAAGLWLAALRRGRWSDAVAVLLPMSVTAVVVMPLALAVEEAFGFGLASATVLPLALATVAWAPTLAGFPLLSRWVAGLALVTLVGATITASVVEPWSEDRPRRLNVVHYTDVDLGEAHVAVGPGPRPPPAAMRRLVDFEAAPRAVLPWSAEPHWVAAAEPLDAPPPTLNVLDERTTAGGRRFRVRVASARGADRLMLSFSPETPVSSVLVEGSRLSGEELPARWRGRRGIMIYGAPAEGVELELELIGSEPGDLELVDVGMSMPDQTRSLLEARGECAVASQWGDAAILSRRVAL